MDTKKLEVYLTNKKGLGLHGGSQVTIAENKLP